MCLEGLSLRTKALERSPALIKMSGQLQRAHLPIGCLLSVLYWLSFTHCSPPPRVTAKIVSIPSRAEVWLNESNRGVTPLTLSVTPKQLYQLELRKKNYHRYRVHQPLSGEHQFTLIPITKTLTVQVTPAPLLFSINEEILNPTRKSRAAAEYTVQLSYGETHKIFAFRNHAPFLETNISLTAKTPAKLKLKFAVLPYQTAVTLTSDPRGSRVHYKQYMLGSTPLTLSQLTSGHYVFTVSQPAYHPQARAITLTRGERKTLSVQLQAQPLLGTIHFSGLPHAAASIVLRQTQNADGQPCTACVETILTSTNTAAAASLRATLKPGRYRYQLRSAVSYPLSGAFTLAPQQTHTEALTALKRFKPTFTPYHQLPLSTAAATTPSAFMSWQTLLTPSALYLSHAAAFQLLRYALPARQTPLEPLELLNLRDPMLRAQLHALTFSTGLGLHPAMHNAAYLTALDTSKLPATIDAASAFYVFDNTRHSMALLAAHTNRATAAVAITLLGEATLLACLQQTAAASTFTSSLPLITGQAIVAQTPRRAAATAAAAARTASIIVSDLANETISEFTWTLDAGTQTAQLTGCLPFVASDNPVPLRPRAVARLFPTASATLSELIWVGADTGTTLSVYTRAGDFLETITLTMPTFAAQTELLYLFIVPPQTLLAVVRQGAPHAPPAQTQVGLYVYNIETL